MSGLSELQKAVISGNRDQARLLVRQALDAGVAPEDVVNNGMIPAMHEVGELFKRNEFYVPEMLVAARAMEAGLDILKPLLAERGLPKVGTVVLGTVKGDLHDIGKNLVRMMLQGAGFEVIDLGIDVSPQKFVEAVEKHRPDHVALSALLTTTMVAMKDTIAAMVGAGVRDKVKVMVGGAPLTESYAKEIGADGYAPDAASAADLAKELLAH